MEVEEVDRVVDVDVVQTLRKQVNYLGHTKSSGAGTIIPYTKLEEIFSLYILIA